MRFNTIKKNDTVNGEGIMVSLWTQGCPHRCKGCHNPETWNVEEGTEFTNIHKEYILECLDANGIHRNLAILGGEPLMDLNVNGVIDLCRFIKLNRPETKIYIWTGYKFEDLKNYKLRELYMWIDVLIDGTYIESEKQLNLFLRGSKNQRVIDIQKTFNKGNIVLYKR